MANLDGKYAVPPLHPFFHPHLSIIKQFVNDESYISVIDFNRNNSMNKLCQVEVQSSEWDCGSTSSHSTDSYLPGAADMSVTSASANSFFFLSGSRLLVTFGNISYLHC